MRGRADLYEAPADRHRGDTVVWKVLIGVLIVVGVLGGAGAVIVSQMDGMPSFGQGGGEVGIEVQLAEAERGDLVRTVSAPGSIEPKSLVKISAQLSAKVLELPFREGERVEAGDVVVRLDPQRLTAQLESAEASLRSEEARLLGAEAGLINARLNYERLTQLAETGDVSRADLEAAEAQFLSAQSTKQVIEHAIEVARARIDEAQKDLENTVIASPISGIITALNAEVGETVIVGTTNNPGSVIMEVADLSEMLLTAQVDETNIAPVREGQDATIYINAFDDKEFTGTVQRIGLKRQVAADGTGVFEVEILIDSAEEDRLYSGMTASTDIAVERFYDVVMVPSQCVLDRRVEDLPDEVKDSPYVDRDKTFARVVYVEAEGKTEARPVEVGPSDLTSTVILAGLEPGERVVAGPYRVLVDLKGGTAIRDRDAAAETTTADGEPTDADADQDADADEDPDEPGESDPEAADEAGTAGAGG